MVSDAMRRSGATKRRTRFRASVLAIVLVGTLTACQPGATWGVAGNGSSGSSGDTGRATAAEFDYPGPLVAVPGGGFYVADTVDCVIRKVDAAGNISTVAGTGTCGNSGDGGPAASAMIEPGQYADLGVDGAGNLYFVQIDFDASSVRIVTPGGFIATIDGTSISPPEFIAGLVVHPDGTLIYNATNPHAGGGGQLMTRAPTGASTAQAIDLDCPEVGLAALPGGRYALSCWNPGPTNPAGVYRLDAATGTATWLTDNSDVALITSASDGTIYITSGPGGLSNAGTEITRIDPDNTITVIAGNGIADPATAVQGGTGTSLDLSPNGLAVTPNNGLLISSGHVVYRLDHPELVS